LLDGLVVLYVPCGSKLLQCSTSRSPSRRCSNPQPGVVMWKSMRSWPRYDHSETIPTCKIHPGRPPQQGVAAQKGHIAGPVPPCKASSSRIRKGEEATVKRFPKCFKVWGPACTQSLQGALDLKQNQQLINEFNLRGNRVILTDSII
jgi:hypothetical protein